MSCNSPVGLHRAMGMSEGAMVPCAKATWFREVGPRTCLMQLTTFSLFQGHNHRNPQWRIGVRGSLPFFFVFFHFSIFSKKNNAHRKMFFFFLSVFLFFFLFFRFLSFSFISFSCLFHLSTPGRARGPTALPPSPLLLPPPPLPLLPSSLSPPFP